MKFTAAGRYKEALAQFDKVVAAMPNRPEGYLFRAAVYQVLVRHFDRASYIKGFKDNSDTAIEKSRLMLLQNPKDAAAHMFLGLASGIMAIDAAQNHSFLTALQHGMKTADSLQRAVELDPNLEDAYYGLGLYLFWKSRSTFIRLLTDFKVLDETKNKGLGYLRRAATKGKYLRTIARLELVWALYEEKRFPEARKELEPLLVQYPNQPLYSFAMAEGFFLEKNYKTAKTRYTALARELSRRTDDFGRLYAYFAEWRIVRSNYEMGDHIQAHLGALASRKKTILDSPLMREVRDDAGTMAEKIEQARLTSVTPSSR
ncbi:MAG: hypothetical protein O2807_03985 [bacterium]|nr:hypothetical protein [bacterium]